MAAAAVLIPLAIELSQLSISVVLGYSYRVTELDDVLLNFIGVLLGDAVFAALRARSMMTITDGGPRRAPSPRLRGRRP
jgi:glycopeptide antibiotics resistance protein